MKSFADFPISTETQKGLAENGYKIPTKIQRESIGFSLQGDDILGAAKTGSGKTLAFLVPLLEKLHSQKWTNLDSVGAIVITPTRELAYQIFETLRKIGKHHNFSAGLIIGGKDLKFETKRMDKCNIVICTPGRLLQHMDENPLIDCSNLQMLVLDEADRCLDLGFQQTMNSIIENLPENRQTLLFSATQTKSIRDLARLSLKDPKYVSVHEDAKHSTPPGLIQSYIICELQDKISFLWSFIKNHKKHKILVFMASCKQVKYMYEAFSRLKSGINLLALYGTLHQQRRMTIYDSFCRKQNAVLFATDIAARGLDFPDVNWVLQLDCPESAVEYIHRAGRTARYKRSGESVLVLLPSEIKMLDRLREMKIPIEEISVNCNKLQSVQRSLEANLARDSNLKATAQRAFVAYVKSVFLMKDKEVFNVLSFNTDAFAGSLGLAIPPRIRFLQKWKKSKGIDSSADVNDGEKTISNDDDDGASSEECKENQRTSRTPTCGFYGEDEDDKEDAGETGFLSLKRKNHELDGTFDESENKLEEQATIAIGSSKNRKIKKTSSKATLAKKLMKKKILPNKKIVFDDEGEIIPNKVKEYVSELAKQYANADEAGIDISTAQQVLREEDKHDKELFRMKVKRKHREERIKLKRKWKGNTEGEDIDDEDVN